MTGTRNQVVIFQRFSEAINMKLLLSYSDFRVNCFFPPPEIYGVDWQRLRLELTSPQTEIPVTPFRAYAADGHDNKARIRKGYCGFEPLSRRQDIFSRMSGSFSDLSKY